ncbi:FUSC family protein [Yersinia mollaretii]|uniref:FUSC family protein n=1 Tax=Yersinia mollaretii TaxID=33060 RepID=UPI0011A4B82B|nr:FUSC family protein [Yersinia mollaretii]
MNTSATRGHSLQRLWAFWRAELAPYPYRSNLVLRLLLTSSLVLVTTMSLRIPMADIALFSVFIATKENSVLSRQTSLGALVALVLMAVLALLLMKFTIDMPLVRIVCASLLCFGGLWLMRVFRFGALFNLIAMLILFIQSWADSNVSPEYLTHTILWIWAVMSYGVVVSLTVNTLLLPREPEQALLEQVDVLLTSTREQLAALLDSHHKVPRLENEAVERAILVLYEMLRFASFKDNSFQQKEINHQQRLSAVGRLFAAASQLSRVSHLPLSAAGRELVAKLDIEIASFAQAMQQHQPYKLSDAPFDFSVIPLAERSALLDMHHALVTLSWDRELLPAEAVEPEPPLFAPDTFTNPVYVRFALKTVLASLICYITLTTLQWSSIHTAMLTTMLIALPSLGASTHKGLLRVLGALVGSLLALLAMVFVMPHITGIIGLLMMTLPVIAVGAWIMAGSERTSYAGMQLIFTYAIALLADFGPTTDLMEIRNRLIGILFGVIVTTLIHTLIWPERAGNSLRQSSVGVLRGMADLFSVPRDIPVQQQLSQLEVRQLKVWLAISQSQNILSDLLLEPGWHRGKRELLGFHAQMMLDQLRELFIAINHLQAVFLHKQHTLTPEQAQAVDHYGQQIAAILNQRAQRLAASEPTEEPPLALPNIAPLLALYSQGGKTQHDVLVMAIQQVQSSLQALAQWEGDIDSVANSPVAIQLEKGISEG